MKGGFALVLTVILAGAASAQDPSFRAETVLREVEVRVTDRDGNPIPELAEKDFRIFERGQQQEIRTFEYVRTPGREPSLAAGQAGTPEERLRRARFVYISAQGRPEDRVRLEQGVRKFIDEQAKPEVLISLEGSPFSSNKEQLYEALEEMLGSGYSRDGGVIDRLSAPATQSLDDFDEEALDDLNSEFTGLIDQAEMLEQFYGRLTLYRYLDLIQALSVLPGSKSVVLFASGLAIDDDNLDLLNRLEAEAMKARVSFYMGDVRGLSAGAPGGDATVDTRRSVGGTPAEVFRAESESFQDSQDGLFTIAKRTGGKALLNSNDFGELLEAVAEDWGDYYLLGYYPADEGTKGRFRRIKVEVDRQGAKLAYRRGYYEEQEFARLSKSERRLQIRRAVLGETPFADLPLTVAYDFFRGPYGQAILAYGVGVHSRDLILDAGRRGGTVRLTAATQATHTSGAGWPAFDEQEIAKKFSAEQLEGFSGGGSALLHYTSQIALAPGEHDWKVVIRDDSSGRVGTYRTKIDVPGFDSASAASSLLVTGRVETISAKSRKKSQGALDVGEARFIPDSAHVFGKGDPIYILFDRYNVSAETLESPPGANVALYREREPVLPLPVSSYEAVADAERNQIRYMAALETSGIAAGEYIVVVRLDGGLIYQKFTLAE